MTDPDQSPATSTYEAAPAHAGTGLDHKLREMIGARLRTEHGALVAEPLPLRILHLLGLLARTHDNKSAEK